MPDSYVYSVELVTTKGYDLVDVLQTLLQPANLDSSDAETTEIIKTDVTNITVIESITLNSPGGTDVATVTISENIANDPLGAGVAPDFVLADFVPSSISDTSRVGFLDNSLTAY